MNLNTLVDQIKDRNDLVAFVRELAKDRESDPDSWEHDTIDHYLEALSAWVAEMDGYFKNQGLAVPVQPSWKLIGQILLASKYYE